jgi:outer membrane protein assembly factor BamB
MQRKLLLFVSLLALQSAMMAGEGKFPSRGVTRSLPTTASREAAKPGPLTYAISFNPLDPLAGVQFGALDIGTGMFHLIADLPHAVQGIARDPGKILAVDTNNNLIRIDPGNGKTDIIGPTGVTTPGPVGPVLVDVFASLATGELFLMDYSNNLYSVDPKTGAATLIGSTGIPPIISPIYASSFAGDCQNLFFTIHEADENLNPILLPTLYRIDPRTGAATLIGQTHGEIAGSGFIDGILYGFSLDERPFGTEEPHVFSIDTSTGAATKVSDLNVPGVGGAVRFTGADAGQCKAK